MLTADVDAPSLPLLWSAGSSRLFRAVEGEPGALERFDPWALQWTRHMPAVDDSTLDDTTRDDSRPTGSVPGDLAPLGGLSLALRCVFTAAGARRVPVGVIGSREASAEEYALAETLGRLMAQHGLQLICGGKGGVMEGACKGHLEAGGAPIGMLPDGEWREGNPYVAIPIATGIGPARNAILARASVVLVAVSGGYGTLTEMAYGLHFSRPVLTLGQAPFVDGAQACATPSEVIARVARHLLEEAAPVPAPD